MISIFLPHSLEEHKLYVNEILSILNRAHFKMSLSKCKIAVQQIEFLRHIVNATTVQPTPEKKSKLFLVICFLILYYKHIVS